MDTSQYLDVFIDESIEHLDVMSNQLLELEKAPTEKPIIEEIFRAAHTIKGMSATMGYQDLANLTHNLENVFDAIRYDKITVKVATMDILFDVVDHLKAMIDDISGGGDGKRDVEDALAQLEAVETGVAIDLETVDAAADIAATVEGVSLQSISALDEFELSIIKEATERGFSNYEIVIELSKNCLLKGARVFMTFEVLEQLGEIIKSEPSINDLEEENFDYVFSLILVSKAGEEEISKKINKISEIESVSINQFSLESYKAAQEEVEKVKEVIAETKDVSDVKSAEEPNRQPSGNRTIRVNIDRLDILMNLFEELVIDRGRLEQISLELDHDDLQETVERMSRVSGDLQNIILNMRMVPINHVFNRFPAMIRQLARELNKSVKVDVIGGETELDRTVIDEIGDPLIHLIRNAIDHGIETPEERKSKGKSEQGTITLKAYHSGNHIFIEISDDGGGINKEVVLNKAISSGIITDAEAKSLTDQQAYELIMASGFSTTESISDVSGRGVGLDVVKTTIETLGGSISIDAKQGESSTFSIQLPLTLSIISVLLVELQDEKYAIPLSSIIETVIIHKDEILSAHNRHVIDFRGQIVPLVFLNTIFSVPQKREPDDYVSVVIVKRGEKTAGLVVDSLIGQQEVVLKSLGDYLTDTTAISGATILGDGQVSLIIDSNALIK